MNAGGEGAAIAVVIPCYRVKAHILGVIAAIPGDVGMVVCVDDACPEGSGDFIESECRDRRVRVVRHKTNQGVGGATMTGYLDAAAAGARVAVKIDGDGQMDAAQIPRLVRPILTGEADYAKGNRFFNLDYLKAMPRRRFFGNLVLSFLAKLSTGYWNVFDVTNGFTAIHTSLLPHLDLEKVSRRFFFETDLMFRLNILRAVVADVPMPARYGDEVSNLSIRKVVLPFLIGHSRNALKRIGYSYFLRDFNVASAELAAGLPLLLAGLAFGTFGWIESARTGVPATAGTVMFAALQIIVGAQLLLSFVNYDVRAVPTEPVHPALTK